MVLIHDKADTEFKGDRFLAECKLASVTSIRVFSTSLNRNIFIKNWGKEAY